VDSKIGQTWKGWVGIEFINTVTRSSPHARLPSPFWSFLPSYYLPRLLLPISIPVFFLQPNKHHIRRITAKMVAVPNIKLNSGFDMPQVGFGLWKVDNSIAADAVYNAIKAGYRLFDGACGM
jgi:hypothetical protein